MYAALPAIGAELGRVSLLSWVITGYLLASAVAILVSGPLIDGWGAQRAFRFAVVLFLVASALCLASPNMAFLIAARMLQGFGGGVAVAVGLVSVGLTHPEPLRARGFAAQSFVWSVVGLSGPPVVAALVATIGWRGVFAVNLPLTAIALAFGWRRLPAARAARPDAIDRPGIALAVVFTSALLIGFAHLTRLTAVWVAVALLALAVYLRLPRPEVGRRVVESHHVVGPPRAALNANVFLVLAGSLGIESFLPVYLRGALGRSQAVAATGVVFLTIGWTIGSVAGSSLVRKWRAEAQIFVATALLPIAIALTTIAVAATRSIIIIGLGYFCMGISVGAVSTLGLTVLQTGVAEDEFGRVNAAHQYVRTVAISAGIALAIGIVLAVVAARVGDVETVRDLLAGDGAEVIDGRACGAIRSGYVWAHITGVVLTAVAVAPAYRLAASRERGAGAVSRRAAP